MKQKSVYLNLYKTCLLFLIAAAHQLHAQSPVITSANFALKLNDKFVFTSCKTNVFDTTGSGINHVWDYSYLKESEDGTFFTRK